MENSMNTNLKNPINILGRLARLFGVILTLALIAPVITFSQSPGNPVSTAVNNQINPMMTTAGSGGTIIT